MEQYLITLDTGTTNTRTILWNGKKEMIAVENRPVGVRNTAIDGHNGQLKNAVKQCIESLLTKTKIEYSQIQCVIASGMITSNVGLCEIPHLVAPISIEDLAEGTRKVLLPDVCPLPIYFIPGMKNTDAAIDYNNLEEMDIMRGEEVESCAIIEALGNGKPMLLVLPGSHTKFVSINNQMQITGCLTTITGELLASITQHTIIADAVERSFVSKENYDKQMLLLGYDTAKKTGLGRTCFSGRILSQFVTKDAPKVANFILGAVLQNDITAIKNSAAVNAGSDTDIIVAGKSPLREAFLDIFSHEGGFGEVKEYVPDDNIPLFALGAYAIAEKNGDLKEMIR